MLNPERSCISDVLTLRHMLRMHNPDWDVRVRAADAMSPLLPGGVHVVGSCSISGNSPPWQPCSTTAAVCACGTSAQTLKWTVCGSAVAPTLLQPAGSGEEMALGTLHVVPGFVPLRYEAAAALAVAAATNCATCCPASINQQRVLRERASSCCCFRCCCCCCPQVPY